MNSKPLLRKRFRDRQVRKRFVTILGGKMLGIVSLLALFKAGALLLGGVAGAWTLADPVVHAADIINPINTVWVLVAAFLVFFMQAGFMALEAGLRPVPGVRQHHDGVHLRHVPVRDPVLGVRVRVPVRRGQRPHRPLVLLPARRHRPTYGTTGVAFLAFFLFQFAFADTASTITSGAMVGRTSFKGDILYSSCVSGFIYPIFGHWVWGPGGWLGNTMGWFNGLVPDGVVFRDFAGSTVVHTVGGIIALVRRHRPRARASAASSSATAAGPLPPHDLTIAAIGAVILWFGWYGFNPGSTLSAMDFEGIGRVAANTTLAAVRRRAGRRVLRLPPDPRSGTSAWRSTASSAASSPSPAPATGSSPIGAVIIGADRRRSSSPLGVDLIEHLRIDDPVGAVPVHGFCGIWGTLGLGLFATGAVRHPDRRPAPTPRRTVDRACSTAAARPARRRRSSAALRLVVVGVVGGRRCSRIFKVVDGTGTLRVSRRASSRASTSTSTARPPTTWSSARASSLHRHRRLRRRRLEPSTVTLARRIRTTSRVRERSISDPSHHRGHQAPQARGGEGRPAGGRGAWA